MRHNIVSVVVVLALAAAACSDATDPAASMSTQTPLASKSTIPQDLAAQALDAVKDYVASGDTPALKDFANGLIPTVTEHLNMAKGLYNCFSCKAKGDVLDFIQLQEGLTFSKAVARLF